MSTRRSLVPAAGGLLRALALGALAVCAIAFAATTAAGAAERGPGALEPPPTCSISGHVTSNGTDGIENVGVDVLSFNGDWWDFVAGTSTDASGAYTFSGLDPGTYHVRFNGWGVTWVTEVYNDKVFAETGDPVTLGPGDDATGIDAILASPAGRITGTVRSQAGTGLPDIDVGIEARNAGGDWLWVGGQPTESDGTYDVGGLGAGTYRVAFNDNNTGAFLGEYYDDTYDGEQAEEVTVTAGDTLVGIDATLAPAAMISGRVTMNGTDPLENIEVQVTAFNGEWWDNRGGTSTDASGNYTVGGLWTDTYHVTFRDPNGDYITEVYSDQTFVDRGADIQLDSGEHATGINAVLSMPAGGITGTVRSEGGTGLANIGVSVDAYDSLHKEWEWVAGDQTQGDGAYDVIGLGAGAYRVGFWDDQNGEYIGEFYDDTQDYEEAQGVTVTAGVWESGIDATLTAAASIEGTVTSNGTDGIEAVEVQALQFNGDWWEDRGWAQTDGSGHYRLGGLTDGEYVVAFRDPSGDHITEYYDDQTYTDLGTPIELDPGEQRTGVSAILSSPAARVAGTIRDEDGNGLPNIEIGIDAYDSTHRQWEWVGGDSTSMYGTYDIGGLDTGAYKISFWDNDGDYLGECYDDTNDYEQAEEVTLTAGGTRTGVDATLAPAASISGRVTSNGTVGIQDIDVNVSTFNGEWWDDRGWASTDASGNYSVGGLEANEYHVRFRDPDGAYIGEFYNDKRFEDQAAEVTLTAGQARTGVNATLASPAGHITGTVRDEGGVGLPNIDVSVDARDTTHGGDWEWLTGTGTDMDGTYDLGGLATGTYKVGFWDNQTGEYLGEFYDDTYDYDAALEVTVTAGSTRTSIDATLAAGASIAGTVTSDGTDGIEGVDVTIMSFNGEWWDWYGGTQTGASGEYQVGGLPGGTFQAQFFDPTGTYIGEYFDDVHFLDQASGIPLEAGDATTTVSAILDSPSGHIEGTVRDEDGLGIPNIEVSVEAQDMLDGEWKWVANGMTSMYGTYDVGGLWTGPYHVGFWDYEAGAYIGEYYDDVQDGADAETVTVTAGSTTPGIDATLTAKVIDVTRVAGANRYATAIEVSKAHFPDDSADTVVLATGLNFPDALAAAPLAGSYHAPLLLTSPSAVTTQLLGEIDRVGADHVFVVGGPSVVPTSVITALQAHSLTVERVAGANRYATAVAIATKVAEHEGVDFNKRVFIARGDTFPDALAVSPFAYSTRTPILLVKTNELPTDTEDAIADLGLEDAIVAGGTPAVSDAVKDALGIPAERWSGVDRYATAATIAGKGVERGWGDNGLVCVATGANFPDALAGGAACGRDWGVLLLTRPDHLSPPTSAYIDDNWGGIWRIEILGGTPAVYPAVETELRTLVAR